LDEAVKIQFSIGLLVRM